MIRPKLALSIRQPWAWLIVNGWKDIENRDWPTSFRGRIRVHAGKGMTRDEYEEARDFAIEAMIATPEDFRPRELVRAGYADLEEAFPDFESLERGGFVGEVDITDCVKRSTSEWFVGEYGFTLADGRPTPFQPYRGQLGFFAVKEAA